MGIRRTCRYYLTNRGFFSELYQLTNAYLYCQENGIDLAIIDQTWNACYQRGLRDYFDIPSYLTVNNSLDCLPLSLITSRSWRAGLRELCVSYAFRKHHDRLLSPGTLTKALLELLTTALRGKLGSNVFEVIGHVLTECSWRPHWQAITQNYEANRSIPRIGSDDTVLTAKLKILRNLFTFNPQIQKQISDKVKSYKLDNYASIHIRRGDKIIHETSEISLDHYINTLKQFTDASQVFIGTDDHTIFSKMAHLEKGLRFVYPKFARSSSHSQETFNQLAPHQRYEEIIQLLVETEIHRKAQIFIGTISSNISKVLSFLRNNKDTTISLDRRASQPIFDQLVTYH